jgi:hypothetical protein
MWTVTFMRPVKLHVIPVAPAVNPVSIWSLIPVIATSVNDAVPFKLVIVALFLTWAMTATIPVRDEPSPRKEVAVMLPLSSIVATPFCNVTPPVPLNLAIALSVAPTGPVTPPEPAGPWGPIGTVKFKMAEVLVPTLVTTAFVVLLPATTVPIVISPAGPISPTKLEPNKLLRVAIIFSPSIHLLVF